MSDSDEVLQQAANWKDQGKGVALATVVTTWGSSPRPVGAKLAVDQDGKFVGSVSGGNRNSATASARALAVVPSMRAENSGRAGLSP